MPRAKYSANEISRVISHPPHIIYRPLEVKLAQKRHFNRVSELSENYLLLNILFGLLIDTLIIYYI